MGGRQALVGGRQALVNGRQALVDGRPVLVDGRQALVGGRLVLVVHGRLVHGVPNQIFPPKILRVLVWRIRSVLVSDGEALQLDVGLGDA